MMHSFTKLSSSNLRTTPFLNDETKKMVVILGATGSGKTRLSIDLAARFNGEIVNSDKMQLYKGLDITTNKIPLSERRGVKHHLLGEMDTSQKEISPAEYRSLASSVISGISSRSKLPIVAGGSNSFVYSLLADQYPPESDIFTGSGPVCNKIRYNCCFLWVDSAAEILDSYLDKRVDDMVQSGMLKELKAFHSDPVTRPALMKAIGVPEFTSYFRCSEEVRQNTFDAAVRDVKHNTRRLARAQMGKIQRLRELPWDLHRLETTDVFRAVLSPASDPSMADVVYMNRVFEPAAMIVTRFLGA